MGRKVRSMRGEMIDFDLIQIKEQMSTIPEPIDVRARQDFIDRKLRRRLKKAKTKIAEGVNKVAKKQADIQPKAVIASEHPQQPLIDKTKTEENAQPLIPPTRRKITKQKARKTN